MKMKLSSCVVHLQLLLLVLEELLSGASGIRWLALATVADTGHIASEEKCDVLMGLNKRQKRVCRRNIELMDYVKSGAKMAIDECQQQFENRRWNCSMVDPVSVFGNVLNQVSQSVQKKYFNKWKHLRGTREAAFVHAISAAGVSHTVTMGCSAGIMEQCGCDRTVDGSTTNDGFEWSGCSHNVAYGNAFSEMFVDARERTKGKGAYRALMNLHNNKAGRKVVEDNMRVQCKCHGVSGSCEMKTCWRAMPTFNQVGQHLKDKFDGATEVEEKKVGTRKQLVPRNPMFKQHSDDDLVYLQGSPDFCESDNKTGSLGTHGRLCNKTSKAIDGCDLLCCGRGFNTRRREIVERCMCKFHWCCYVKCQKCVREVEEHYCR